MKLIISLNIIFPLDLCYIIESYAREYIWLEEFKNFRYLLVTYKQVTGGLRWTNICDDYYTGMICDSINNRFEHRQVVVYIFGETSNKPNYNLNYKTGIWE